MNINRKLRRLREIKRKMALLGLDLDLVSHTSGSIVESIGVINKLSALNMEFSIVASTKSDPFDVLDLTFAGTDVEPLTSPTLPINP